MKTNAPLSNSLVSMPLNAFSQAIWQQAAIAADCASALFRGVEEIRKVQGHAAHAAAQRHTAITEKFKGQCNPRDLLALQTELYQFDIEGVTRYWQQIGSVVLELQSNMLGYRNQLLPSDTLLEAAAAIDRATGRGIASARE